MTLLRTSLHFTAVVVAIGAMVSTPAVTADLAAAAGNAVRSKLSVLTETVAAAICDTGYGGDRAGIWRRHRSRGNVNAVDRARRLKHLRIRDSSLCTYRVDTAPARRIHCSVPGACRARRRRSHGIVDSLRGCEYARKHLYHRSRDSGRDDVHARISWERTYSCTLEAWLPPPRTTSSSAAHTIFPIVPGSSIQHRHA